MAQPTVDATASGSGSTPSFSFDVVTGVANAVVFVKVGAVVEPAATAVTVGGVTATLVDRALIAGQVCSEIWRAVGLGAAGTKAVVVTTDTVLVAAAAISVAGADQVTPERGSATATGDSADITVGITSAVDDLVLDSAVNRLGFPASVNGGGDQTELVDLQPVEGLAVSSKSGAAGTVTMAWTIGGSTKWATVAISIRPAAAAGPQGVFMESGTDATFGTEFFTDVGGAVSSSTTSHTGPRSLLCDTSSPAVTANARKRAIMADAGRRFSVWVRFSSVAPSADGAFINVQNAALTNIFSIVLRTTGVLRINAAGAGTVDGTTGLSADTWYRISVAYTITNTTTFTIKLFLNGVLEASAVNIGTLTNVTTDSLNFQSPSGTGINRQIRFDDLYVDDGTTLDDLGDIRVTAKLPAANNTNSFDTAVGANPANRWTNVNERALSLTNGWEMTTPAAVDENYTLEAAGVGDVSLAGATLVARLAWVWTKTGSAAADAKIMDNGVATAISTTTTAALARLLTTGSGYPSNVAGIGMVASPTVTTFLYECGMLLAYRRSLSGGRPLGQQRGMARRTGRLVGAS